METSIYRPQPLLAPFVEAYVISNTGFTANRPCFHPSNLPILCFDSDKRHFKASGAQDYFNFSMGIVGVVDHFLYLDTIPKKSIQVVFKPYGAFRFFGTPMHLFVNTGIDLQSILPNLTGSIEQLQDKYHNNEESIKVLDQLLAKLLKSAPDSDPNFDRIVYACETMKRTKNTLNVSKLCSSIGMSETRFRKHFKEKIGVSPKKFSQIETFQQIRAALHNSNTVNWMDLVEEFSFHDQTHFINNFKWFFGCTPTAYVKRQNKAEQTQREP